MDIHPVILALLELSGYPLYKYSPVSSTEDAMTDTPVPASVAASFESLKRNNEHGAEYWSARDLQPLLGYGQWRRFEQAVERAITSCETSGNNPENHFAGAGKMVDLGSGSQRKVEDFHLSRFACYLIAQNGDPRKPEIAHAQKYFAIQARRQELNDQAAADMERLELRKQTAEEFKALSGAAQDAGVQSKMFGIFHDAGYKGLYGGLGRDAIKRRKMIPDKDNLLDRMNATELAANQFRMTQTRDKLARERVSHQAQAIRAHEEVGREVRDAIKRIGGTLPESISPAEHIKEVEKRLKSATPKLQLDEREAGGLLGDESRDGQKK
jgi:DNA-damage-inducible protein D